MSDAAPPRPEPVRPGDPGPRRPARVPAAAVSAVLLAALSITLSFCHLMASAPRLLWPPQIWVAATVRGGLYWMFSTDGAAINVGAILAAFVLAARMGGRSGFPRALAGACLLQPGLAMWGTLVLPMSGILATSAAGPDDAVPADFVAVRSQWEFAHAGIALVKPTAVTALLASGTLGPWERRPA